MSSVGKFEALVDNVQTLDPERDYVELIQMLAPLVGLVSSFPLAGMSQTNERMQAVAPLLEVDAYRNGGGNNLVDQRAIIDAALHLQHVAQQVRDRSHLRARRRQGSRR